jgi:hypothetical protein
MVVLDYYDGPASGFLTCKVCGAEHHFLHKIATSGGKGTEKRTRAGKRKRAGCR